MQLRQVHGAYTAYSRDRCQEQGRWTLGNVWHNASGMDKASEGTCTPEAPSSCSGCFLAATREVLRSKGISAPSAEPKPTKKKKKTGKGGWEENERKEKCSSNMLCWYGFSALQANFNARRLKTDHASLQRQTGQRLNAW